MRIATSEDMRADLHAIRRWDFRETLEAHQALDALQAIRDILTPTT